MIDQHRNPHARTRRDDGFVGFIRNVAIVIAVGLAAYAAISTRSQVRDNTRANEQLRVVVVQLAKQSRQIKEQNAALQESRVQSTIDSCEESNARHEETVERIKKAPETARQVASSLLDAAVPFRANCVAYAHSRTKLDQP